MFCYAMLCSDVGAWLSLFKCEASVYFQLDLTLRPVPKHIYAPMYVCVCPQREIHVLWCTVLNGSVAFQSPAPGTTSAGALCMASLKQ